MRHTSYIALLFFVASAGVIFTWKATTQQKVQEGAIQLLAPFNTSTSSFSRKVQAAAKGLKTLPQLEEENKDLKVENEKLRTSNQMLNKVAQENDSLRQALSFKERSPFKLIPARVIARESATWWSTIQIDRGEADGIDTDMPVVTDQGLVGKTTTVAKNTSYVLLIADENCKVAATIEGTRESGILSGERVSSGTMPDLTLNFLAKAAVPNLRPGLKVFSSGVGGVFPSGVLLGTLKTIEARPLDALAKVQSSVDLSKLENVFVVVSQKDTTSPVPNSSIIKKLQR